MLSLRYVLCDVFTERALAGNPLAVFTDARRLDALQMQALARETNLSETVFVLPPERGGHARIRIFTPRRELPFAGHPTLGAAFVLGGPLEMGILRLELAAGIVPVTLKREGPRVTFGWMTPPAARPIELRDGEAVLAALGVSQPEFAPAAYSNGPEHVLVPLASAREVADLLPNSSALAAATAALVTAFHFDGARLKVRVFAPRAGVIEDPATGSAAGALATYLHESGKLGDRTELVIDQGHEVGRPSELYVRLTRGDGGTSIEVGGGAVIVARGQFTLPEAQDAAASEGR
jgi:trans-2,3-dihydro-3-hydroxyanthranilate isomerase